MQTAFGTREIPHQGIDGFLVLPIGLVDLAQNISYDLTVLANCRDISIGRGSGAALNGLLRIFYSIIILLPANHACLSFQID